MFNEILQTTESQYVKKIQQFLSESNTRKSFQVWANLLINTLVFHCCQTPIWKAIQHENETTKKTYTTVSQSLLSKIAKIENDLSSSAKYKSVKFAPKKQLEYQIAIYFPYKVFQNKINLFLSVKYKSAK